MLYAHPSPWNSAAWWHTCKYTTASDMNLKTAAITFPPSNAYAVYSQQVQWLTMNMASCACRLNLIKVIMLCCGNYHCTSHYAPHRCNTVEHYVHQRVPTASNMLPVLHTTHATPNYNISALHAVPWHCVGATLLCIVHDSPSTCLMVAQLLTVVHPASRAMLQRLGCVSTYYLSFPYKWLCKEPSVVPEHRASLLMAAAVSLCSTGASHCLLAIALCISVFLW